MKTKCKIKVKNINFVYKLIDENIAGELEKEIMLNS